MSETTTPRRVNAGPRPIKAIVADVYTEWGDKVDTSGYAAKPYLKALSNVESAEEMYGDEKAEHLLRYLLSNLAQFKGQRARELKEELRDHLPKRSGK
jgi:hypothetical protein